MLRGLQRRASFNFFFQFGFSDYNIKIIVIIFVMSQQNFWHFISAAQIFNFVNTLLNIVCRSKHHQFAIREKANYAEVLHNLNWTIVLVLKNINIKKLSIDIIFIDLLENYFLRISDMLL